MRANLSEYKLLTDQRDAWLVEFARALGRIRATVVYSSFNSWTGAVRGQPVERTDTDSGLRVVQFPVQRGFYSRFGGILWGQERRLARWLRSIPTGTSSDCVLICCFPHYASVAEMWPGPVIYYVTDLFRYYDGWGFDRIRKLERRMCRRADLICPNSRRTAEVLVEDSGAPPDHILVLPNAVHSDSLLPGPLGKAAELPAEVAGLGRPVAGVIGDLSDNTDWVMLEQVVEATPWLSWLFVGPHDGRIADRQQAASRMRLLTGLESRVMFVGRKPFAALRCFARAFDVAILPYRKKEPTYSGSPTRFYEHLAATRPMVATDGCAELLPKTPLLRIVSGAKEMIAILEELRANGFRDGLEEQRWLMSHKETLEDRVRAMTDALEARLGAKWTTHAARRTVG